MISRPLRTSSSLDEIARAPDRFSPAPTRSSSWDEDLDLFSPATFGNIWTIQDEDNARRYRVNVAAELMPGDVQGFWGRIKARMTGFICCVCKPRTTWNVPSEEEHLVDDNRVLWY